MKMTLIPHPPPHIQCKLVPVYYQEYEYILRFRVDFEVTLVMSPEAEIAIGN